MVKLKLIVRVCSAECADGYFGHLCNNVCLCYDETEVCDKVTGHCESGCMAGRTDAGCQSGQHIGCCLFVFVHSASETELWLSTYVYVFFLFA